jgi:hypothetical protein
MSLRRLLSISGFLYALATWLAAMIDGALLFILIDQVESVWFRWPDFLQQPYWFDWILTGAVVGLCIQIVHDSHRGIRKTVAGIRKKHSDLFSLRVQHAALECDNVPHVPSPPDRLILEVYGMWWIKLGIQTAVILVALYGLYSLGIESAPAGLFLESLTLYTLPRNPTLLNFECYAFWFFLVIGSILTAAALISLPLIVVLERPLRDRLRTMDEEIELLRRNVSQRAGLGPEQPAQLHTAL